MACSIDLDLWGVVGQNMQSMASVAIKENYAMFSQCIVSTTRTECYVDPPIKSIRCQTMLTHRQW